MDARKLFELIPDMKSFHGSLIQGFVYNRDPDSSGQYCLAVEKDDVMYGCGWYPQNRSRLTVKDRESPVCSCPFSFLMACWRPDVDTFWSHYEAGNMMEATEAAKAYFAGRCYISFGAWVILGIMISGCLWFFLSSFGQTYKDLDQEDPRLVGSSLDRSRAGLFAQSR